MGKRINLDMGVLRTFVAGFELGSFGRAADRLGRSQSAVSAQLRKLEEQVGEPLVQKAGRKLSLTTAGEGMLSYARRILELNDEAVDAIRGSQVEGWVRLGLPQDFAESSLPEVLARFARAHPKVRVEVQVDRSVPLVERTVKGELDLALVWGHADAPHAMHIAEVPIAWIGRADWPGVANLGGEPLPLIALTSPCPFRSAGIAALDAAGIAWRLTFTSLSLSGLWAAAEAGLGITLRTAYDISPRLAVLDPQAFGLPELPSVPLTLYRAQADASPAAQRLLEILLETLSAKLGN